MVSKMDARDEVVLTLTDDFDLNSPDSDPHSQSVRRMALIGHLAFRLSALLLYLFCTWFTFSFILPFVAILVMLSLDFWFTKNISGRVLIGLRWYSYTDPKTGKVYWRYDARKPLTIDTVDPITLSRRELVLRYKRVQMSRLFWIGLIGSSFMWFLFALGALFSLNLRWAILCLIGLGMSLGNLYGYLRCKMSNLDQNASNVFNWIKTTSQIDVLNQIWPWKKTFSPSSDGEKAGTASSSDRGLPLSA